MQDFPKDSRVETINEHADGLFVADRISGESAQILEFAGIWVDVWKVHFVNIELLTCLLLALRICVLVSEFTQPLSEDILDVVQHGVKEVEPCSRLLLPYHHVWPLDVGEGHSHSSDG